MAQEELRPSPGPAAEVQKGGARGDALQQPGRLCQLGQLVAGAVLPVLALRAPGVREQLIPRHPLHHRPAHRRRRARPQRVQTLLGPPQLSHLLGCSVRTVQELLLRRLLVPGALVQGQRPRRREWEALEALLERRLRVEPVWARLPHQPVEVRLDALVADAHLPRHAVAPRDKDALRLALAKWLLAVLGLPRVPPHLHADAVDHGDLLPHAPLEHLPVAEQDHGAAPVLHGAHGHHGGAGRGPCHLLARGGRGHDGPRAGHERGRLRPQLAGAAQRRGHAPRLRLLARGALEGQRSAGGHASDP
mmetsp:Transcript_21705/g.56658  ORF Transcript_21705/g.56658 Transcript_21705/m.56658 type:complete len:305 (+) Transcript_21705:952-1866(+)